NLANEATCRMQVAVCGGLRPAGEVLGIDHRAMLTISMLVDHLDVLAALRRQLPGQPANRGCHDSRWRAEPGGLVTARRRLHELRPDGDRHVGCEPVRQNRLRLIEADPDSGGERWREADEPGVVEVVGRPGLACSR